MVVLVLVLVLVSVTGGSGPAPRAAASTGRTPAPASLLTGITTAANAVADRVGAPDGLAAPKQLAGEPVLSLAGKAGALYVGAEFCPYCAADMWPMVIAFSRFGSFSGLGLTTSSAWDVHPSTATFSFYGSTYTSDYVTFETVEHAGTDTSGPGTHRLLQSPTKAQAGLWQRYTSRLGTAEGYPFLDLGNRFFLLGSSYDPSLLSGLDQQAIAAKLSNPDDPVARAIVGSANELTAAICATTGDQPAAVCSAPGTVAGAHALGLR